MIKKMKHIVLTLLRKSERYTKTDMVYLAQGGFWLVIGQGAITITSFALSVAFANLIPKETLGTYRFILSALGILSIPTLGGINTAITRSVANHKTSTFFKALKTKIYWGTIGGCASICISAYYFYAGNTDLSLAFLISAVFLPFMDSFILYDSVLQGKKDFKTSSIYFILSHLIAFCISILTLSLTTSVPILVLSYFIGWTLARGIFLVITIRTHSLTGEFDHSAIPYGKHLSAMGIIGTIANSLDRLLIFHLLGGAELAIYSIIIGPPEQIKGLLKHIYTLSLPKFSSVSIESSKKTIWNKTFRFMLAISILVFVYILIAPLAFKLIFPMYAHDVFYSQIYALSLIPIAFMLPYSLLESSGSTKILYKYNTYTSVIEIGLFLLLIPSFGIWGVIYAKIVSRVMNFVIIKGLINQKQPGLA